MVLSGYERSGVTSNTIDLCEGLVKIGHDVTLVIGKPEEEYQLEKEMYVISTGVKIEHFTPPRRGLISNFRSVVDLSRILLAGHFDIIHMESIYLSFIPKMLGKKFVTTLHSFGLKKNLFSPRASRLITISEGIKDDAMMRHGYSERTISTVLHGCSLRFAEPYTENEKIDCRRRFGIPVDKTVIGIVGSIEPRKGHHFLLEAVSGLSSGNREKLHLVFCGSPKGNGSEEWIASKIESSGLRSQVTVISHCDPLDVYRSLDIFCLPSVWEGFPLVVVEAMLSGNCVIRSNVQGAKEQIIEGQTGYTFESQKPQKLRQVIEQLLSDKEAIKNIGSYSRKYAMANFSLETMARNTAKVYYEVIRSQRARQSCN